MIGKAEYIAKIPFLKCFLFSRTFGLDGQENGCQSKFVTSEAAHVFDSRRDIPTSWCLSSDGSNETRKEFETIQKYKPIVEAESVLFR